MTRSLVVLGGTGDLTGRLLLPSLAALVAAGDLAPDVEVRAVDRADRDDETYRRWARERLAVHAPDVAEADRQRLVDHLRYSRGDVTDAGELRTARDQAHGPPIVYLALPTRSSGPPCRH